MSSRERILDNIRARLGRAPGEDGEVDARLHDRPRGPRPARADGAPEDLQARFAERARAAAAEVHTLTGLAALAPLVAELCRDQDIESEAVVAPDSRLDAPDWAGTGLRVERRAARAADRIAVSHAVCGVAETGTLVLASGPDNPVTLDFLPELHVVALAAQQVVGSYEDAWARLRARGALPRTVNWITGPSRSADIEQTLQLGAHGPVRLIVALV